MENRVKPGRWLYVLSIGIFISGIIAFTLLLINTISNAANSNQRIIVPGKGEVVLNKPGKYTIYLEYRSEDRNRVYSTDSSISDLNCEVMDASNNGFIELSQPSVNTNYSIGERKGKAIFNFYIDKPGTYEISGEYDNNSNGPEVVLAVGNGLGEDFVLKILADIFVLMITLGGSIFAAIITYNKRNRGKWKEKLI